MHRHTRYVFLSFLKLGHTRRTPLRGVACATDHRRGTVAWLMKLTRLDPAGPLFKIWPFILPIPPYSTPLLPLTLISPLFSISTLPPLIITSTISPTLLLSVTCRCCCFWYLPCHLNHSPLVFSPFPRYVSLNLYSFLLYFCLLVIISFLVVSCYLDMIMSRPRL